MPRLRSAVRSGIVHPLLAVALTWPLALHLTDRIPLGTEDTATVPLFNLWTLRWESAHFRHGLDGFWTAPIFHPAHGTLAFSEVQPLTALLFTPIEWITGNPVLGYNLVLLAFLALNGWAGGRIGRRMGLGRVPAVLVGVLAEALPFVANELGVLQLAALFPVLLVVDFTLGWATAGGWRPALGAAVALAATFATSVYYGLFVVLVIVPMVLVLFRRGWLTGRRVAEVAGAVVVAGVLTLPFLRAQQHWIERFSWTADTVRSNSAAALDYLRLDPRTPGHRVTPWLLGQGRDGQRLYPGSVLLLLGAAGAWTAWRARPSRRRLLGAVAVGLVVACVLSLGLNDSLLGVRPFALLRDHIDPLARLRSPFRMAVVVQVLLLVPASLGLRALWGRGRGWHAGASALVLAGLLEVAILPAHLTVVPPASTDWSRWLARQRSTSAVAMVPFVPGGPAEAYEPTVEAMLLSLEHGKPLVNGYSGFFPAATDALAVAEQAFPDQASLDALVDVGVRWVVVNRSWVTPDQERALADWGDRLAVSFTGEAATVYELR